MKFEHRPTAAPWLAAVGLTAGALLIIEQVRRRSSRIDLHGNVVLITGGSRGLGLCMARQLATAGARVAICGRDPDTLRRAHEQLLAISANALAFVADVTRASDVDSLVNAVTDQLGPIDVLINNVATIQVGPAQLMTEDDYRAALDQIFWSTYRCSEAVIPAMRERGGGRIVNINSVGGLIPAPHLAPYVTAKHAMLGYSRAMRNELARDGIVITTVTPGLMRTGSPRNVEVKGNFEAEYAWFKIADSLPLTSASAERSAALIIDALAHGDAELTITLSAKVGARLQAVFPNLSARFGAALNRLLPAPRGSSSETRFGRDVESGLTQSTLTALSDVAARSNNEMGA